MIKELFDGWKAKTSALARLQWVYGTLAITLLLVGGVTSLVDYQTGTAIAGLSIYLAGLFVVNFVANAVIINIVGDVKTRQPRK